MELELYTFYHFLAVFSCIAFHNSARKAPIKYVPIHFAKSTFISVESVIKLVIFTAFNSESIFLIYARSPKRIGKKPRTNRNGQWARRVNSPKSKCKWPINMKS